LQLAIEFAAVETRHSEIRDDRIERLLFEDIEREVGVFAACGAITQHADHLAEQFAHGAVVIQYQYPRGFHIAVSSGRARFLVMTERDFRPERDHFEGAVELNDLSSDASEERHQ